MLSDIMALLAKVPEQDTYDGRAAAVTMMVNRQLSQKIAKLLEELVDKAGLQVASPLYRLCWILEKIIATREMRKTIKYAKLKLYGGKIRLTMPKRQHDDSSKKTKRGRYNHLRRAVRRPVTDAPGKNRMNVHALAEKSGVSKTTILNWESGSSNPTVSDALLNLAKALNVSIRTLMPKE